MGDIENIQTVQTVPCRSSVLSYRTPPPAASALVVFDQWDTGICPTLSPPPPQPTPSPPCYPIPQCAVLFTSKLVFVTSTLFVGKITAKLITAKLCFRVDVCYNSMGYCLSEFNEISVLLNYSTDNQALVFPTNSTSF